MPTKLEKRLQDVAHTTSLAGLFFDFVMEQPLNRLVESDHLVTLMTAYFDEQLAESAWHEHHKTFIEREIERAQTRGDTLRDWLDAEFQMELRSLVMQPVEFDRRFLREVVQQQSVRHMTTSIIQETLDRFASTLKPSGSGGGLVGSMGRGALGFASRAGKGILGQLGGQFESHLQTAIQSFVKNSTQLMLERLVVILSSPETARYLGQSGGAAYDALVDQSTESIWTFAHKNLSTDDLLDTIPGQLRHIIEKSEFRELLLSEFERFLAVEGDRPLKYFLGTAGAYEDLRAQMSKQAAPLIAEFAQSAAFKSWTKD